MFLLPALPAREVSECTACIPGFVLCRLPWFGGATKCNEASPLLWITSVVCCRMMQSGRFRLTYWFSVENKDTVYLVLYSLIAY